MNDIAPERYAQPVRRGEEERHFKEVETFSSKRERMHKTINWGLAGLCGALLAIDGALAFTLAATVPTIRAYPVFYERQMDGSIDQPKSWSSLSASQKEQDVRGVALQLVENCEGYNFADAQRRYDICGLMLTGHARAEYQARWFLPNDKPNPDSNPQLLYPNGQIEIDRLGNIEVLRGHVAEIHFRRIVDLDSKAPVDRKTCKAPVCTTWTATIDFQPAEKMSQEDRDRVPSGLVATRYQLSEGKL